MFIFKNSPKRNRIPENTSRNGAAIDRTPVVASSLQQSTSAPSFTQVTGTSDMGCIRYIDIESLAGRRGEYLLHPNETWWTVTRRRRRAADETADDGDVRTPLRAGT